MTISIGIVAVALIPLLGMVPTGLNVQRRAIDSTLAAQITQKVSSDAEQADFDSLLPVNGVSPLVDRYFTDQAQELLDPTTGKPNPNDPQRLYDVRTTVVNPTPIPSAAGVASSNLATLKIQVANNPGHVANPFVSGSCSTYFIFVARNEGATVTALAASQ